LLRVPAHRVQQVIFKVLQVLLRIEDPVSDAVVDSLERGDLIARLILNLVFELTRPADDVTDVVVATRTAFPARVFSLLFGSFPV